ncbi:MAG: hypothetical protein OXP36_02310 [Gammaproteobacteria bacterium]|nr:hypothetical protein [Gammaproteobacteria bacterium]
MLNGQPIAPLQRLVLLLDPSHVDSTVLTPDQRTTILIRLIRYGVAFTLLIRMLADSLGVVYWETWIAQAINQHLRVKMIENAEHLSLRYQSHARTGDTIYRVFQDSRMISRGRHPRRTNGEEGRRLPSLRHARDPGDSGMSDTALDTPIESRSRERFDDRVDINPKITNGEAFRIVGRSLAYLARVKGLFAAKVAFSLIALIPGKILIDQVILKRPFNDAEVPFPPYFQPVVDFLRGMAPMEIMLYLTALCAASSRPAAPPARRPPTRSRRA